MRGHIVNKSLEPPTRGEEERIFEEFLHRKHLKVTKPRQALLKRIFAMHDHFTADQLMDRLGREGMKASKATVYRTLAVLLESGLLASHDFGEGALYYEHTFGHAHHDHLFCLRCKRIVEFFDDRIERLQDSVAQEAGFRIMSHSLKIFGLCKACSTKAGSGAGRGRTAAGSS